MPGAPAGALEMRIALIARPSSEVPMVTTVQRSGR